MQSPHGWLAMGDEPCPVRDEEAREWASAHAPIISDEHAHTGAPSSSAADPEGDADVPNRNGKRFCSASGGGGSAGAGQLQQPLPEPVREI